MFPAPPKNQQMHSHAHYRSQASYLLKSRCWELCWENGRLARCTGLPLRPVPSTRGVTHWEDGRLLMSSPSASLETWEDRDGGRDTAGAIGPAVHGWVWAKIPGVAYPIGSMYAIYGNIYHQYTPNVSIYTSTMDPMGTEIPGAGRKNRFIAAYSSVVLLLQNEAKQLGPPAPYPAGDGAHWNSKPHTVPVCLGRFWGQRKLTPMLNMYTLFVCVCVPSVCLYLP